LLAAAIRVFARDGFEGASIREVAGVAGMNTSLISYHFGGKAGLYTAALQTACRMARNLPRHLPPPPSPQDPDAAMKAAHALQAYIRKYLGIGLGTRRPPEDEHLLDLEPAVFTLLFMEMAHPKQGHEVLLQEGVQPHIDYVNQCLSILQPGLGEEGLFRTGVCFYAQLLFFFSYHRILPVLRGDPSKRVDLDSIAEQLV
jgi:AcrR family transcriptional regulator